MLIKNLISQIASNIEVIIYFYNVEQCSGYFIVFIVLFNIELKNEQIVKMNMYKLLYLNFFFLGCLHFLFLSFQFNFLWAWSIQFTLMN